MLNYSPMKLFSTIIIFLTSFCVFSQKQKSSADIQYVQIESTIEVVNTIKAEKANNSVQLTPKNFQFIIQNNIKPLITEDILNFVEQNRTLDTDITIDYSEKIKVFIPSTKTIQSPNYLELPLYK